jgi:hypothetical protein
MDRDLKKELKKIIGEIQCSRELCCMDTGFDRLCKTKDVGLKTYLECLEKEAPTCPFSVPYGSAYYCSCPLRVYIRKNLGK